jgi:hypothetical protein
MTRTWRAALIAFVYVMSVAANLTMSLVMRPSWLIFVSADVVIGAVIGTITQRLAASRPGWRSLVSRRRAFRAGADDRGRAGQA